MRIKVDSVPIVEAAPQRSASDRSSRAMAAVLAALLLSACSSKNPDSLVGMNVDENLAMMNASEMVDGNLAATTSSGSKDSVADFHLPDRSARAAKNIAPQTAGVRSVEVNAADALPADPPTDDDNLKQSGEEPNAD